MIKLIKFGASYCAPCRAMMPILEELKNKIEIEDIDVDEGWPPQQARSVLPNSLKTELVMTGTIEQWRGFFKLRCDKAAHPQARELAVLLKEEFLKRNYIES